MKIGFIGCGNMASAMIGGIIKTQVVAPADILASAKTEGSREAHIATAKAQDAVGEFQLLKQTFYVVQHLLVGLFAVFRFVDAYQFHFGEFVQAVQATYVFPV